MCLLEEKDANFAVCCLNCSFSRGLYNLYLSMSSIEKCLWICLTSFPERVGKYLIYCVKACATSSKWTLPSQTRVFLELNRFLWKALLPRNPWTVCVYVYILFQLPASRTSAFLQKVHKDSASKVLLTVKAVNYVACPCRSTMANLSKQFH